MKKFFPFLEWIPNYKRSDLQGDVSAGLTVGVMLIPQGMAYSMLAGLPPIYGLYASTIPLILYALFGTSRQLAVGPVAMVALLISSGVGQLVPTGSDQFISYAILLALIVGIIQFSMGALRLGFLVNFLSHPVIAGFTSAAALIIGFSQLKHLLGLDIPRGKVHETLLAVFEKYAEINLPTMLLGMGAILVLLAIKRINKRIPGPLIVVLLGIPLVYFGDLAEEGVKIVREVPQGLPSIGLPSFDLESIRTLLPTALTISFVGFMESIAVAKAIQAKHKDYQVIPNQELIGLGLANIGGAFFKAFPTTGGFSRTAVNDQAGARTGLASILSALLIILTLLFLTSYFYYLPKAVLASIIMVAVFGLIDVKEAKHLWKTDRKDFFLFGLTALATLTLGIEQGILLGVAISLLIVLYHVSYPHVAELGRVPGTKEYRNVKRFEVLDQWEDTLIMRFDAQLYFANLNYFRDKLTRFLQGREGVKYIVLDCKPINNMDSSAVHMIHDLMEDYQVLGIQFFFADVKGPVRDIMKRGGIFELIGEDQIFLSVEDAIQALHEGGDLSPHPYAIQTSK